MKQAAKKQGDVSGDGTTSTVILTQQIITEGLKQVASGATPRELVDGIKRAADVVVNEIKSFATPVKTEDEIKQVATISANNDDVIGQLLSEAHQKVGSTGTITVEEAKGIETGLTFVEGMNFDRGYVSPYFVTNQEKMTTELENAYVLICDKKITTIKEMLPILEPIAKSGRAVLIIAEDIEGEALTTLVINRLRGGMKVCAVKAPGFGDRRKAMLQDIAVLTNATVITEEVGLSLENATPDLLGEAKRIIVKKDDTTIVDGAGTTEQISQRTKEIEGQIATATSDYDKEKLQERLAKLSGGIGIISVGAATEIEMKEKKDRVDDAYQATKAAIEEGIVPGGGLALTKCLTAIETLMNTLSGDVKTGVKIVYNAITAPLKQIATNAGKEGAVIFNEVMKQGGNIGYNARTNTFEDMIQAGIVDPAKVVRTAITNAVSVSCVLLTTEATIYEEDTEASKTSSEATSTVY